MALGSTAVFAKRVQELKLGSIYNDLVDQGWDTYRPFAFSCSSSPGQADDTSLINEVIVPILTDPAHKLKTQLRRLFYEAYTMTALDVQRRASPSHEVDRPKKLPAPERLSRMRTLKSRLKGLVIEEDLEPSDSLIDTYNAMREDGNLKFLAWNELTRRDDEIRSIKKTKVFETDSQGRLKAGEEAHEEPADAATDLKLKYALQRRGVAMEIAQLLIFETHETYVNWLCKQLSRRPPVGFHAVSVSQVHQIDRKVFVKLADQTREGLETNTQGTHRLNALLLNLMNDPQVAMLAMPQQRPEGQQHLGHKRLSRKTQTGDNSKVGNNQGKGQGKSTKVLGKPPKGQGRGKGKNRKGYSIMMPHAFKDARGECVSSYNGKPICFCYHLQGCNLPVNALGECPKGLHVCARKGCGANHPQHYAGCPKMRKA